MVDGLTFQPFDKPPAGQEKEVRGKDATSASKAGGGSSSAGVPVDLGPPAPDPNSGSAELEEKGERDPKEAVRNADEMGRSSTRDKVELKPGEERSADLPDDPGRQLVIRLDEELQQPVFQIREKETGEVVREVPPQELAELSKRMPDLIKGMLVDNIC
jgi:uncharacterized FlaG/YvyC family protein